MINDKDVKLGDRVKDKITGYTGITVAITEFLNGCRRILVSAPLRDGQYQDERWFDEPQLAIEQRGAYQSPQAEPTGGDRPDCPPKSGGVK